MGQPGPSSMLGSAGTSEEALRFLTTVWVSLLCGRWPGLGQRVQGSP